MAIYILVDSTTGEVYSSLQMDAGDSAAVLAANPGTILVSSATVIDDSLYLYDLIGLTFVLKDDLTDVATWDSLTLDADATDAVTLGSGLPNPTIVSVTPVRAFANPAYVVVTTGSFVFKTDAVGLYSITARAFPYNEYTVTVEAV